jgi:aspartokinase
MPSIAHTVKKLIDKKPFLQEALLKEIINYGALADLLIPDIKVELGIEPKHGAVMMAIRRYQDKLTQSPLAELKFTPSSFTIRSGLFSVTIENKEHSSVLVSKFREVLDDKKDSFFTVSQGVSEITIIAQERFEKEIIKLLKKETVLRHERSLTGLSILIPKTSLDKPGVYFQIVRRLAWEAINIHEIFSTNRELVILISEVDTTRAFNCLKC